MIQLLQHDCVPADLATDGRFVEYRVQVQWIRLVQPLFTCRSDGDRTVDLRFEVEVAPFGSGRVRWW
jgi:hypothetical protein